VLHPRLTPNAATRRGFREEAELLMRLEHDNIVRGLALGRSHGLEYFAMEYVDGDTLLEYITKKVVFNEDAALYVILQIARALEYLNREGVVHRDVKPGNILLTRDNTVKLCDLGFAATTGSADGESDTTVGTVAYISPEQARGRTDIDIRSDIYSLGVTLYHMVIGELPFHGSDDSEVLAKQILESLSSEELKGRGISDHLHYFIQKMMAKNREIRYADPAALISDISEHIRGKKTLTYNPLAASEDRESADENLLEKPFHDAEEKPAEPPPAATRSWWKPAPAKDDAARRRESEIRERLKGLKRKRD
jgi:eukaryotic-like serine/threonine-protein kinase